MPFILALLLLFSAPLMDPSLNAADAPADTSRQIWPVEPRKYLLHDLHQDPATLPVSADAPSKPVAVPFVPAADPLTPLGDGTWKLVGRWKMVEAPRLPATGAEVSRPGFPVADWYDAEVPGTVLTTLVARGVYPDPYHGLNNLNIPETLNKQDYWFRTEFTVPADTAGRDVSLDFQGINYAAEVWLNGTRLGEIHGAFMRGAFDLTPLLQPGGSNALAVRVSPPPHPGVPHEQSLKAGAGPNGGALCVDGPTFICTEGWDWIPGIRDRCTGIWQDVLLHVGGPVRIGDPQVTTTLPLPDTSRADVGLSVELTNHGPTEITGKLRAEFEGVSFEQAATLPAGATHRLYWQPTTVQNPRLWWPNGYGKPELYDLSLTFTTAGGAVSDVKKTRFGIREVSYELTALDPAGNTPRLDYRPALANGQSLLDPRHEGIVHTPAGWLPSLTPAATNSPALQPCAAAATAPFLVVKVNGVPIICKGGNWGMDDALKRVSRERLEPYVRLERDAHMTMVRNWCGQSTEEAFYDLCDEYGLMVWNDFWQSTQLHNEVPYDVPLFLANARDTVSRFRNHPSIVLWCGRNEGVPPPALNEGLDAIVRECDGTRFYQSNSRSINLLDSGPWDYGDPARLFKLGHGFTTELGLPSPPTVDAMRAMLPAGDQWPISDGWAYHDWHQDAGGNVAPFMHAMEHRFGKPHDLADFCRKAQLLNYESHRAMFEGLTAVLWKPASGRLMWMTHPSLPSMNWQLYGSDYEASGAYFGARQACEPVHVQMNPDGRIILANSTPSGLGDMNVTAEVFAADGTSLWRKRAPVVVTASGAFDAFDMEWPARPEGEPSFLKLTAMDDHGLLYSENFYWHGDAIRDLPSTRLELTARLAPSEITVTLVNPGKTVALQAALTLRTADGERVLPVFYDANYLSLLPGEKRNVRIQFPPGTPTDGLQVTVCGWNVNEAAGKL